jgi:hypothetical protein
MERSSVTGRGPGNGSRSSTALTPRQVLIAPRGCLPDPPQARMSALGPESGSTAGSSQPEAPSANRLRANCKRLSGDSAVVPSAPELSAERSPNRRDPVS